MSEAVLHYHLVSEGPEGHGGGEGYAVVKDGLARTQRLPGRQLAGIPSKWGPTGEVLL